jgi:hypothetical protein
MVNYGIITPYGSANRTTACRSRINIIRANAVSTCDSAYKASTICSSSV